MAELLGSPQSNNIDTLSLTPLLIFVKMRHFPLFSAILLSGPFLGQTQADTIYSNLQNIAIPTGFDGVYLDVDTGTTGIAEFAGWDINPFFGGVAIGNSPAFQPVRAGTDILDRVLNLAPGSVISGGLTYSSGYGGSGDVGSEHIGAGGDQFQVGSDGYLGFKFTTNGGTTPLYGWIRMSLTNNIAGALIKDWGYDNAGGSIVIGRVQQSAASGGAQTVTLSPGIGESFALGSAITDTGGNVNSLIKIGSGTTTLTASNAYTGTTSISNGYLNIGTNNVTSGSNGPLGNATSAIIIGDANTVASTYNGAGPNVVLLVEGSNDTVANSYTINRNIDSSGSANVVGSNDIGLVSSNAGATSSLTISGNWALSTGASRSNGLWAQKVGQTLNFTGLISGGNASTGLRAGDYGEGVGTVRLSNASNNYTSQTYVSAGTLLIAGDALAGSGVLGTNANLLIGDFSGKGGSALTDGAFTVGKTITLQDIGSAANTWTLGGNTANASSFTGNITPNSLAFSATLNLSQVSGGTTSFSGIIAPNPNSSFVANVVKVGGGTVILTNANTYDGTTTVTAGTLLANNSTGSATSAGAVGVSSGATLGGSGSISGATTISSGGIHTAGTSVTAVTPTATLAQETFTTGITYDAGSIFEWNLTANADNSSGTRGVNYDAVNTASLASNGTLAIFRVVLNGNQNFGENFWNSNRTWGDIFTNVATNSNLNIATVFASTVEYYNSAGLVSNVPATQGYFTISGSTLSWTAVPEPTSALVGLLITAGLLRRRRQDA